jgi:hypothetical protein
LPTPKILRVSISSKSGRFKVFSGLDFGYEIVQVQRNLLRVEMSMCTVFHEQVYYIAIMDYVSSEGARVRLTIPMSVGNQNIPSQGSPY